MKNLLSIVLAVCACVLSNTVVAQDGEGGLESVTYLLPAPITLPAFAPYVLAEHLGYYKDAGLDIRFVTAKGGIDAAKQVGAGNAMMGGILGDTPVIVRPNGVPIKTVAQLGSGSLMLVASNGHDPVKTPGDLKGKTITVMAYTDNTYYSLLGALKKAGLGRDDADIQAVGPVGVWQLFASGKSDVMAAVPEWIVNARQSGKDVYIMNPSEGFDSMAQAIGASENTIKERPDLVKKIVSATTRGMKLIMNDPDAAVKAYTEAVPAFAGKDQQVREIFDLYNKYVYAGQKVPGKVDVGRLDKVQKFYVENGIVQRATPLEDLYTNQFIEQVD